MKNILLTIAYDGTNFSGWQRQPGRRTVQGELEKVLSVLCKQEVNLEGTSRTDSGVHALGQRATLKGNIKIPVENIPVAANNMLAEAGRKKTGDVRILCAQEVGEGFHARFNAVGKTYLYRIQYGGQPHILERDRCYHIKGEPDVALIEKEAQFLVGKHDFKAFMASGGKQPETTVRNIFDIKIHRPLSDEGLWRHGVGDCQNRTSEIILEITGDGFLYNMVRIITGTLMDIGTGRILHRGIPQIIEGCDRRLAGHTAPPQGLYLAEVYFDVNKMLNKTKGAI
ncbi:MAG: tRNA pseudouridine(38-40) synthase TruA [Anaerovoracaceae bacterium]|jgi:tRNA pseudouridine38-40 synthase